MQNTEYTPDPGRLTCVPLGIDDLAYFHWTATDPHDGSVVATIKGSLPESGRILDVVLTRAFRAGRIAADDVVKVVRLSRQGDTVVDTFTMADRLDNYDA